ncbi:MAG: hypothetical protein L3J89_06510 [Gammaproteobacteria bacterium]|nr:hypothetical protein [Gammaproteobacteria bacterium]
MRLKSTLLATLLCLGTTTAVADSYDNAVNSAINENYSAAFSHWMPLAKAGDARAQFNVALMYHGGLHVKFDESAALEWYQLAAANGVIEAQEYLAVGYKEGWFGLPVDNMKANYWQHKVAAASL